MKYLKLFEELNPNTYWRAARKLKEIGHVRRSSELENWYNISKKKQEIEKWSKFGTFHMNFYDTRKNELLFDGEFHICLEVDIDFLNERIGEINSGFSEKLYILFYYAIYPANKESEEKMLSIPIIRNNLINGGYSDINLSIRLSDKGFQILPKAECSFDNYEDINYLPSNRKEAIKLHRLLINLFEEKMEIPAGSYGTIQRTKSIIEEMVSEEDIWTKIVSSVKNMSVNYLYRK